MAVASMPGLAHDRDDLIDRRRVGGVSLALIARGYPGVGPGVVAGERRRPAASSSG